MEAENDNTGLPEMCSVCGKLFKDGEGRFRRPDAIYCVECYKLRGPSRIYSGEKQEFAVIQDDG